MGWRKRKKKPIPHESEVWAPKRTMVIAWCNLGGVCFFAIMLLLVRQLFPSPGTGSTLVATLWIVGSLAVSSMWVWRISRWVERRPTWWTGAAVWIPTIASIIALLGMWFAVLQIEPVAMPLVVFCGWMILYALVVGPLTTAGSRRRVGGRLHCAKCEYERSATIPDSVQLVCPECGAEWNREDGLAVGMVQRNARMQTAVWYAIAIWLGLTFFFFMPLRGRGWMATIATAITPTNSMIEQAAAEPYDIVDVCRKLAGRSLTDSQLRNAISIVTTPLARADEGGWENRYAWVSALLGSREVLAPTAWSDGDAAMLLQSLIHFTIEAGEHDQQFVCASFELAGLQAGTGRYLRFYLMAPHAGKSNDDPTAPQAIKGQNKTCVTFDAVPSHESIEVPILIVAIPDAPRTSLTPPAVGEPSMTADGSLIPPAGALWSRVVPVRVKVEPIEK